MSDAFLVLTFEALFHRLDWTWSCLVWDWVGGLVAFLFEQSIPNYFRFYKEQGERGRESYLNAK